MSAYWRPYEDIDGADKESCCAFIFPSDLPDALIVVWWDLANTYASPSFLLKVTSGLWHATFVEE